MFKQSKEHLGNLQCVIAKNSETNKPAVCVILCHGYGAPSDDLVKLSDELTKAVSDSLSPEQANNVVYVFPAAPIELEQLFDSRAWWMIDIDRMQQLMMSGETRDLRSESPGTLPERRSDLTMVIDHCRINYDLPASKIVIGGFSQGAMLSTDVALHYPERLGGLIVWSGSLINESIWLEKMKSQPKLDIVQSHGRIDPILPMLGAEDLRDEFTQAGHNVKFHEFSGQHSIPLEGLSLAAVMIKAALESG